MECCDIIQISGIVYSGLSMGRARKCTAVVGVVVVVVVVVNVNV